jgi:hypothetical protein
MAEAELAQSGGPAIAWLFGTASGLVGNADDDFESSARKLTFLEKVFPRLASDAEASMAVVVVPWDVTQERMLLVLLASEESTPPRVEARVAVRQQVWVLTEEQVAAPSELRAVAASLQL